MNATPPIHRVISQAWFNLYAVEDGTYTSGLAAWARYSTCIVVPDSASASFTDSVS